MIILTRRGHKRSKVGFASLLFTGVLRNLSGLDDEKKPSGFGEFGAVIRLLREEETIRFLRL
jgi:hypothetical protein